MGDPLDGWPVVARLVARLERLRPYFLPLRGFGGHCLRGDPADDTIFLSFSNEMTESPNPDYAAEWTAFLERLRTEPMPATRVAREGPRPIRRSFGPHGIRLEARFDRGPARRRFPMLSVCDFGETQISLLTLDGPVTAAFRELENALWGAVYEEVTRFERESGTHNYSRI